MHNSEHLDLMLRNDIERLADEARRAAARAALGSAEHDFYSGVGAAAERFLHPGLAAVDDLSWLDREPPAFRDGFLEASTMIAMASAQAPVHLPLPVF
jgi:hypothetical protein